MARYCRLLMCMLIVFAATALASAQSLGDVARTERGKQKPQAARTYTNDDIPSVATPKDEPRTAATDAKTDSTARDKASDANADKKKNDGTSAEKQNELNKEWTAKIAEEKANVAGIEREINLMQREQKLRFAVYYSDAGNRLRDDKKWADDQRQYQDDLASRQKDLADANAKLAETRDAARKAGATSFE